VAQVAQEAKVATGSVYNYFDSKEHILHTVFRDMWSGILSELTEVARRSDLDHRRQLERMVDAVFDRFSADSNLARVFVNEQSFWMHRWEGDLADLFGDFMKLFGETLKGAGLKEGLDPAILRYFIFGGVRQLIHQWADPNCTFTRELARSQILKILDALNDGAVTRY